MKLITDTCSAIKLLAFGNKLFASGVLPSGDLVFHSRVFRETRKWPTYKKDKYKTELQVLAQIGNKGANLAVSKKDSDAHAVVVVATKIAFNLSVGQGDIEQLISAIHHDHAIVTDDGHFGQLVEHMDVNGYDAEDIVLEALGAGVVIQQEVDQVKAIWHKNGEKMQGKV